MPAKKTTILVVDDDLQLLKIVEHNLEAEGYQVLTEREGKRALETIERDAPDLVLLDIMLPRMDGFQVCQRVREFSAVPIIMITARGQSQDKIKGLDLGADDYLTKPFRVDELLARVRAVLRRAQFTTNVHLQALRAATTIGELRIDYAQHQVTQAGREVALTPTEYRILVYLAQNAGVVVTQDLLLEHVWGAEYVGEGHMLRVNVNRLRHKLETDPLSHATCSPGQGSATCSPKTPIRRRHLEVGSPLLFNAVNAQWRVSHLLGQFHEPLRMMHLYPEAS